VKSKAAWVSETALLKQLYLSLMQNTKSWKRRAYGWTAIRRDLLTMYPDRVPQDERCRSTRKMAKSLIESEGVHPFFSLLGEE